MIGSPKPYSAYKPSDVEWLEEVPAHWEVRRFKQVSAIAYGDSLPNEGRRDGSLLVFGSNGPVGFHDSANTSAPCVVIGRKGSFGKVNYSDRPIFAIDTTFFIDNRLSSANLRWIYHLLGQLRLDQVTKDSAIPGLDRKDVYTSRVPVPSISEQAAIAHYLDRADGRIRRYTQAKKKLVELLEEQRQALINEAVTGRVDVRTGQPYPEYKPSGVEWLGEVPAHWVVASLRHRYQQRLGKMLDSKRITGEHLLPYLRNVDVQWDKVNVVDLPMMDILPLEIDQYTVQSGDLIVCEGGEVGRCAIWRGESGVLGYQKALHRLRPHRRGQDNPRFMYHTLRHAVASEAFNDGHESTIGHLTGDKLRAHRFPFPPSAEQTAIAHYLDRADERIRRGIQAAQRQIDLLKEYRTRLIADVVTGKLDVREAAAELEGDLEEQESITGPDASAVMGGESARIPNVATQGSDV